MHQIQNLPRVRSRHSQNGLSSNKHGLQYGKSNRIYTTVFVVVLRVGSLLCLLSLLRQKRECVHNTPPTRRHLCGTNRHHHLFVCKSKTIICLQKTLLLSKTDLSSMYKRESMRAECFVSFNQQRLNQKDQVHIQTNVDIHIFTFNIVENLV